MNPFSYIHKSPHRNQLESYLRLFLPKLSTPILDIGSKNRRYDFLMRDMPTAVDLVENKDLDIGLGNITNLSFADESFGSLVCLEVLEYVGEYRKGISEAYRVLIKGGTGIFSVPFMYRYHQDKVRYTREYLMELFKEFSEVSVLAVGNFYTIILDILRGKIIKIRLLPLRYFAYVFYFPLVLLVPFSRIFKDEDYVSGYLVIAKK